MKRTLPLLVPTLTLPVMLLLSCADSGRVTYQSQDLHHAQTPLATITEAASLTECAVRCRGKADCVQWARDRTTGLCRLWPPSSAENPLTHDTETVYQTISATSSSAAATAAPPSLPDGFTISDDPTVAYLERERRVKADKNTLITSCHDHHPDAFPAVPRTEVQFNYLKNNMVGNNLGIGVSDEEVEGVFRDITTGAEVVLSPNWWYNGQVLVSKEKDCVKLVPAGLDCGSCSKHVDGYICQYNVPVGY